MSKKFLLILVSLSLFSSEVKAFQPTLNANIHGYFISAWGYTKAGNPQQVWLAMTPEPGLENTFTNGSKQNGTFLLGLGIETLCPTNAPYLDLGPGIELDYLKNRSLAGVVNPMVNVAPDFDILNYSYNADVYTLFATAKLSRQHLIHPRLGAYLQGGIGWGITRLTGYHETSPLGSSAAPMLAPFRDKSNSNFAYFIGVGVSYRIHRCIAFQLGYRYMNSGSAGFKSSPVQQTNNTPSFSLSHHLLTVSLVI